MLQLSRIASCAGVRHVRLRSVVGQRGVATSSRRLSESSLASLTGGPRVDSSSLSQPPILPTDANIVIIGGGVIGCSIAYHLAKAGVKDVYLLEKSQLTHGCTWHAAGLLGQLRGTKNLTRMLQYSAECFSRLHADTGCDPEWRSVGSLRVASSIERWKEVRRSSSQASSFGFDMHLISPSEAARLCPVLETSDLHGAAWIPTDGHVEPTSLTNAFAKGARDAGVRILQGVELVGSTVTKPSGNIFSRTSIVSIQVRSLRAEDATKVHTIQVRQVVNCGGLWGRQVGQLLGTNVPTTNLEHQYLVTDRLNDGAGRPAIAKDLPSFRDPDARLYFKPEMGGLVVGGWEADTRTASVPHNFGPELYEGNMDRFEQHAIRAAHRVPLLGSAGVRRLVNGPIPVSPDGEPILGLCPEHSNVFAACGFTAGIGASGGAGKYLAEWMIDGEPSIDLWPLDIRRFSSQVHGARPWLDLRALEAYGRYYELHYPGKEHEAGRNFRRSGMYEATKAQGAVFGSKFGWERPLYFARDPQTGQPNLDHEPKPSFNRRQDRTAPRASIESDFVRAEHLAARNACVVIDQSSFAKLEVRGRDAEAFLQRLTNNDLAHPPGTVVYTQMLNERGGIEADVTIARIDDETFYVITGSGYGPPPPGTPITSFATRDFGWIRSHLPAESDIRLHDVTNQFGVINVTGPNSRKLLEAVGIESDISHASFPFMTCRDAWLACGVRARLLRVTFVGELGFELHVPAEQAHLVYSALFDAVSKHPELGVVPGGYRVLETLRLEKAYRVWGSDLGPQTNPLEAGLAFCCKWDKPNGFIGDRALMAIRERGGPSRRLVCFTVAEEASLSNEALGFTDAKSDAELDLEPSDPLVLSGNEAVTLAGQVVGYSTSAGFGYAVGKHIVYAFLPRELADRPIDQDATNAFHLNAYGMQVRLVRHPNNRALYDHKREKILV